ncbi:Hypothetical predicted protein, partial [Pelobates cultripes]
KIKRIPCTKSQKPKDLQHYWDPHALTLKYISSPWATLQPEQGLRYLGAEDHLDMTHSATNPSYTKMDPVVVAACLHHQTNRTYLLVEHRSSSVLLSHNSSSKHHPQ